MLNRWQRFDGGFLLLLLALVALPNLPALPALAPLPNLPARQAHGVGATAHRAACRLANAANDIGTALETLADCAIEHTENGSHVSTLAVDFLQPCPRTIRSPDLPDPPGGWPDRPRP